LIEQVEQVQAGNRSSIKMKAKIITEAQTSLDCFTWHIFRNHC